MVSHPRTRPTQILISGVMTTAFLLACAAALQPWAAQLAGGGTPPERAIRAAISIDPGNVRFHVTLANLYQYDLLLRDYPAALSHYQSALRSNPLDSASWLQVARLYQKLDRPAEADRARRLAVQLAPSDSTIMWEATLAYLEAGQPTEALDTLTRFISMSRDDTDRAKGYDLARRLSTKAD